MSALGWKADINGGPRKSPLIAKADIWLANSPSLKAPINFGSHARSWLRKRTATQSLELRIDQFLDECCLQRGFFFPEVCDYFQVLPFSQSNPNLEHRASIFSASFLTRSYHLFPRCCQKNESILTKSQTSRVIISPYVAAMTTT